MNVDSPRSRRDVVSSLAVVAATTLIDGTRTASAAARPLNFNDPTDNVYAYFKTIGDTAPRTSYTYTRGRVYGAMPGAIIKPLMDYESGLIDRTEAMFNGGFRLTRWETMHFLDIDTGAVLKRFDNPFTGKVNEPIHGVTGPLLFEVTPQKGQRVILDYELERETAPFLLDWRPSGDRVTLRLETLREYPNPVQPEDWPLASTGATRRYGDFLTWTTSLNDLQNEDLSSAPATLFYSAQTNWQPWMFMGQGPGHLLWHASGAKYNALEDLPVSFVETVEGLHPDLLHDTDSYLDDTGALLNELALRRDAL